MNMDSIVEKSKRMALEYMMKHPEKWTVIDGHDSSKSFMLAKDENVQMLMNEIDTYSNNIHSGASISLIMRYLKDLRSKTLH